MPYLSVANFWKYQNADVWKKSKGHPPWFKHYVHRDREMDSLPIHARLLWVELLAAASRYSNVLEADLKWIWAETRIDPELIAEALPMLISGGWLSETDTPRRSRKPSRKTLDNPRTLPEEDKDGEQEQEKLAPEVPQDHLKPPDQKRTETTPAAGLEQLDVRETLEELGARLAARAAPLGSEGRLFEVLPDMDEHSPTILRALLDTLPAHTIEQVREEIIANKPRKPTAYAVDLLKKQQVRRGRTLKEVSAA